MADAIFMNHLDALDYLLGNYLCLVLRYLASQLHLALERRELDEIHYEVALLREFVDDEVVYLDYVWVVHLFHNLILVLRLLTNKNNNHLTNHLFNLLVKTLGHFGREEPLVGLFLDLVNN